MVHSNYRPDIDGLRAVAVFGVVAFHAFPNSIKGGFIGVDVFFVISGYLITAIIANSLSIDDFDLFEFYSNRIRRIFPSLILVLIFCLIYGWLYLLADEYKKLGRYTIAGGAFISNLVLWSDSGYFDTSAETKPLLHLWSLGVEEQFYLAWPVLLSLAWRYKLNLSFIIVMLGLFSFAFGIYEIKHDAVGAFYSPLSRVWELLCGSLLAVFINKNRIDIDNASLSNRVRSKILANSKVANILSILGVLLLIYAFYSVTKEKEFPGLYALLPVISTLLLITAGPHAWINRNLLSNKVAVWFGLISYPMYLWHWPLLSFSKIVTGATPEKHVRFFLVILAVVISWITYRIVERPIRFGNKIKIRTSVLMVSMLVVTIFGAAIYEQEGFPNRSEKVSLAANLEAYSYFNQKTEMEFWRGRCFNIESGDDYFYENGCVPKEKSDSVKKVFVLGDSHSAYLSEYLNGLLKERNYSIYQFSVAHCTPLSTRDKSIRCGSINRLINNYLKTEVPDLVIVFAYYSHWADEAQYGEVMAYDDFIKTRIMEIKSLGVKRVVLVGHIPTWDDTLPHILSRRFIAKNKTIPGRTYEGVNQTSLEWDARLSSIGNVDGVYYLSLKDLLCNVDGCLTSVGPNLSKDLIVFDYGHLTINGAKFISENLIAKYIGD